MHFTYRYGTALAGVEAGEITTPAVFIVLRIVGVVVCGVLVLTILKRLVRRVDDERLRDQLHYFLPKAIGAGVVLCAMAASGLDVSGMAAILATVGVTGAVAFTPVGQNLVAGAMIRIDDVYEVGEVVTVGELHGKVVYRSMLRTELELPDGSKAWVPNSGFQDGQVLNHSRMGGWRICVQVPLDRSEDRTLAHQVMARVMADLDWNRPGKQAFVAFDHVGSEAMFFNAYAWIEDRTREPWYRGLLLSELVDALEEVGVSVGQTTNLSIRPPGEPTTDEVPAIGPATDDVGASGEAIALEPSEHDAVVRSVPRGRVVAEQLDLDGRLVADHHRRRRPFGG